MNPVAGNGQDIFTAFRPIRAINNAGTGPPVCVSTVSVPALLLALIKSNLPSPFTSATATPSGPHWICPDQQTAHSRTGDFIKMVVHELELNWQKLTWTFFKQRKAALDFRGLFPYHAGSSRLIAGRRPCRLKPALTHPKGKPAGNLPPGMSE